MSDEQFVWAVILVFSLLTAFAILACNTKN